MVRFPLFRTRAAAAGLALAASLSVATPLASTTFAAAVPTCQFVLGFQTLHSLSASVTGDCTANQAFAANGDAQQPTTNGLMVWRKADNFTAFTDGFHTWVNGPKGVQARLNTERFPWEAQSNAPAAAPAVLSAVGNGGPADGMTGQFFN